MRFKDTKDTVKALSKVPGPWVPGYWALMRGAQKRRANAANKSKAGKK